MYICAVYVHIQVVLSIQYIIHISDTYIIYIYISMYIKDTLFITSLRVLSQKYQAAAPLALLHGHPRCANGGAERGVHWDEKWGFNAIRNNYRWDLMGVTGYLNGFTESG